MEASSGESMPPEQQVTAIDPSVLVSYLKTGVALLEKNQELHPSFLKILDDPTQLEKIKRFITDAQCKLMFIERVSVKGE